MKFYLLQNNYAENHTSKIYILTNVTFRYIRVMSYDELCIINQNYTMDLFIEHNVVCNRNVVDLLLQINYGNKYQNTKIPNKITMYLSK